MRILNPGQVKEKNTIQGKRKVEGYSKVLKSRCRFNPSPFLLRTAKSSAHLSTPKMEPDLQRPSSPRLSNIPIVDQNSGLAAQLGPFQLHSQPFAPLRTVHHVEPQPLQNATPTPGTMALGSNAHGMPLLQSANEPSQDHYDEMNSNVSDLMTFTSQWQGQKLNPNPPDLDLWRNKLFNVYEMITLSEEQYAIYARLRLN